MTRIKWGYTKKMVGEEENIDVVRAHNNVDWESCAVEQA